MSHIDYFNRAVDKSDGRIHEVQLVNMLASIAESLSAIADILERKEEIESEEK